MGEDSDSETIPSGRTPASGKKKRNSNFSVDEIKCLISEFGNRANLLNFGTRDQKQKCWEEITETINTNHPDFIRTVTEVKKKWIDLLYSTKKQYIQASTEAEGNGQSKRRRLSDIAEMIVKVKGGFSSKYKTEDGIKIINFQLPETGEIEASGQPAFYISNIEDCDSNGQSEDTTTLVTNRNANCIRIKRDVSDAVIDSIESYESYNEAISDSADPCSCNSSSDFLRLQQEEIGLIKRMVQIEEERRLEEKQKWWEAKTLIRLQKQKLELEIKALRQSLHQSSQDT